MSKTMIWFGGDGVVLPPDDGDEPLKDVERADDDQQHRLRKPTQPVIDRGLIFVPLPCSSRVGR